jgi:zinc protease
MLVVGDKSIVEPQLKALGYQIEMVTLVD